MTCRCCPICGAEIPPVGARGGRPRATCGARCCRYRWERRQRTATAAERLAARLEARGRHGAAAAARERAARLREPMTKDPPVTATPRGLPEEAAVAAAMLRRQETR